MSATTEWLSAAGGIIGAVGGPAGLWAAWNVHQESRRRREAEPEELITHLANVRDLARQVAHGYKDEDWFETSGADEVIKRFEELTHLVRCHLLRADLGEVSYLYSDVRFALTFPHQTRRDMLLGGQPTSSEGGTVENQSWRAAC